MTAAFPRTLLILIVALVSLLPAGRPAAAQGDPTCGVVDEIVYPVDDMFNRGDDFALYRSRFGGLHVGLDVAFYDYGDPVYAIANGRVTYADPYGWDTEKGVVIVEHTFPSGEIFYSLYGHMEPLGDYFFPGVGQCVTPGRIVGAVGDPSLSAPHMHFEIRTILPDDGGPGYWDTNPLEAGWLHPLDFVQLWQLRLQTNDAGESPYISHVSGLHASSVTPIVTDDGGLIVADSTVLEGVNAAGALQWRMELTNTVTGMLGLPDGRVIVRTSDNTVAVIQNGRYTSIWTPDQTLSGAPMQVGEAIAFFTADNAVAAYTPDGTPLWLTPPLGDRLASVTATLDQIAVGTRPDDSDAAAGFHLIDGAGHLLYQVAPANPPLAAFGPANDYYLLDGGNLYHIGPDFTPTPIARIPNAEALPTQRNASLLADGMGRVYVFIAAATDSRLYAYNFDGTLRWDVALPGEHDQPPLLATGTGCLVYALDATGGLYVLDAADGTLRGQTRLYAGGRRNGYPNARLLDILPTEDGRERVRFGAGFLTVITLDGYTLAGITPDACPQSAG